MQYTYKFESFFFYFNCLFRSFTVLSASFLFDLIGLFTFIFKFFFFFIQNTIFHMKLFEYLLSSFIYNRKLLLRNLININRSTAVVVLRENINHSNTILAVFNIFQTITVQVHQISCKHFCFFKISHFQINLFLLSFLIFYFL